MKIIFNIAKNELKTLFCSPIAWSVLILVAFQASFFFEKAYLSLVANYAAGNTLYYGIGQPLFTSITGGLLGYLKEYLYIYVPLLTMGLMSKEYSEGSIKLLYSSPIGDRHIIFGKYLAMIIYLILIVLIPMIFVLCFGGNIVNMEWGKAFTALLGFYLLICTYSAIGLFMSTLTSYQIVAAISTMAILIVLNFVGGWWQTTPFLKDLSYWLSIKDKLNTFYNGFLTSRGVLYYVLISAMFVTFSILFLKAKRTKRHLVVSILMYVATLVCTVLLGYLTSLPKLTLYADFSNTKQNLLSERVTNYLMAPQGDLTITMYVNVVDDYCGYSTIGVSRKIDAIFEKFVLQRPSIKFDKVYYYATPVYGSSVIEKNPGVPLEELAKFMAKRLKVKFNKVLTPEQIAEVAGLKEDSGYRTCFAVKGNDKVSYVKFFDDPNVLPGPNEVALALALLSDQRSNITFLTGHGERSVFGDNVKDYTPLFTPFFERNALINAGFKISEVRLTDEHSLDNTDILFVADPRTPYTEEELALLKSYIDKGGNMFLLSEPNRIAHTNPIAKYLGIEFDKGTLVMQNEGIAPNVLVCPFSNALNYKAPFVLRNMVEAQASIFMTGTSPIKQIDDKGYKIIHFTKTFDNIDCWNELESTDLEDPKSVVFNAEAGEVKDEYSTMLFMERNVEGKQQRVVVSSDADWFDIEEYDMFHPIKNGMPATKRIFPFIVSWASNDKYPLLLNAPGPVDMDFKVANPKAIRHSALLLILTLPLLLFLGFLLVLANRRNK